MSWITKAPESPVLAHVLDGEAFNQKPRHWRSLCGLALSQDSSHSSDLPRCPRCEQLWSEAHPRRKPAGRPKKLPRCTCPMCGTEHINRGAAP